MVTNNNEPRDIYKARRQYERIKELIREDEKISPHNQDLLLSWLEEKENTLKRRKGRELQDELRWSKTLSKVGRLAKMVAEWVGTRPLDELTPAELTKIYDDLEEGNITKSDGKPYSRATRTDFYNRLFKSDFGKFMGWRDEAREIMVLEKREDAPVKYFTKDTLKKLVAGTHSLKYKTLYWLLFDTGLRVGEALNLRKGDVQEMKDEKNPYRLIIRASTTKSKRDRYVKLWSNESNEILGAWLSANSEFDEETLLFPMNYAAVKKHLSVSSEQLKLYTEPDRKRLAPHDFRRSCATYWLTQGVSIDLIKARLGHKPSSAVIDRYVSYLGLDENPEKFKDTRKENDGSYKELLASNKEMAERMLVMQEERKRMEEVVKRASEAMRKYDVEAARAEKEEEKLERLRKEDEETEKRIAAMVKRLEKAGLLK